MLTLSYPKIAPSLLGKIWQMVIGLPWYTFKTYPPIFLVASSAAYASSQFAAHQNAFPFPFNVMQAIAFEWVYLGAIALASRKTIWFLITVISGALTSMLYIFLHSADVYGLLKYATSPAWLTVFALCHAIPLTIVGVSYMILFHINAQEDYAQAQAQAQEDQAQAQKQAFKCPRCARGFASQQAVYAHSQFCKGSIE